MMVQGDNNAIRIDGDLIHFQPVFTITKGAMKMLEKKNQELRFTCNKDGMESSVITVSLKKIEKLSYTIWDNPDGAFLKSLLSKIAA